MSKRLTQNPKRGRPRVYATDLPVYDSMEQCEGATGIPKAAQMIATSEGCLFFRHGRVHLAEFLMWWFAREADESGDSHVDWSKRDKRASALTRETNLQKLRDALIDFSSVEKCLAHVVGVLFFGEIEKLVQHLPARLKAKNEIEIAEEMEDWQKRIKKSLSDSVDLWVKKRGNV